MTTSTPYIDATRPLQQGPLLGSPNKLKLAVFCANVQRGTTQSHVPETLKATWADSLAVVRAADAAGIEALIPLARWRRAVTTVPDDDRIFETFTWAAAVAAVTSRAQVFATVHIPLVHPLMVAKAAATVDHISGGRFALNVVAGWNTNDFDMFGYQQREHDDRYAVASEWMAFISRIWTEHAPFDFAGSFYQGRGVISEPKPVQSPRPVIMSAGSSPAGQAFAQRWADINFAVVRSVADAPKVVTAARESSRAAGRHTLIFGAAWIICRDTEQEAQDYFNHVIREKGDSINAEATVAEMLASGSRSIDVIARQNMVERSMGGFFALQLVGTPAQVVAQMQALSDAGLDGLAISWVDYAAGLKQYTDVLRPLLVAAGLRVQ